MTVVNSDEGGSLDGVKTGSVPHRTGSHCPSSPLRAFSSYRLKRLSSKKRPRNEQVHELLPDAHTADSQVSVEVILKARGMDFERLAQDNPLSAAVRQQQSSNEALGACLASTAGITVGYKAADQSGLHLRKVAGMCGESDSWPKPLAGLSGSSSPGRHPLQTWVPRKRNLASFDVLDELPNVTSQKQHPADGQGLQLPAASQSGPNRQPSAGLPLSAPKCLPVAQEPALQKAHPPGCLTASPADLLKGLKGTRPHVRHPQGNNGRPCSGALSTNPAATSQLSWHAGRSAPSRRLHHKPFAAPRPMQRPEAELDTSNRPFASSSASAACGGDTSQMLENSSAAILHYSPLHPDTNRHSHPVSRRLGSSLDTDGVTSDSEDDEASDMALDRQSSGNGAADVASVDELCSMSPVKVHPHEFNSSKAPQQMAWLNKKYATSKGHAGSYCAQALTAAAGPSRCDVESAIPASTAAAGVAAPRGTSAQSAGRKRLKRLYDSSVADRPSQTVWPKQDMEMQGGDAGLLADLGVLCRLGPNSTHTKDTAIPSSDISPVLGACPDPVSGPAAALDNESSSGDADSLATLNPAASNPVPQLQGSGRRLKRLRRITDTSPDLAPRASCGPGSRSKTLDESAHPGPAAQGAPRANPFMSAKAALPQEPKLACHTAPAQPQGKNLGDVLLYGDLHALLGGQGGQKQAGAGRSMGAAPEATAGSIIDLASDDSFGGGEAGAGSPIRPQARRICLPGMPSSPGRRPSQGQSRSYLGAYSSADIMPEPTQPGRGQLLLQEPASARARTSPDRDWQGSRLYEEGCSRNEGAHGAVSQAPFALHSLANLQWDSGLDFELNGQPEVSNRRQSREHSGPGSIATATKAGPAVPAEAAGASRQPRHGPPWWHRLDDFVPVAAIAGGRDPRDGSKVLIEYRAQLSGDKHPTAAGGGFQQVKMGRKTQHGAPAARVKEATREEGLVAGHWMTTYQHGRRRKVYVTAGDRKQLTGRAAHTTYERDKRAEGCLAKDT